MELQTEILFEPLRFVQEGYFVIALLFVLNISNTILFSCTISLPDTAACNFLEKKKLACKIQSGQLFQWKWLKTTILWVNGEKA